ncbi:hypothetical protein F4677DRAFT_81437 [Hypoxylon crocopeplum]|nr:hypothetical protein F4677DRAFT_81437 [Hypoxylon crocopeplum]
MDDPWGSPWASSEATPKHDPLTPSPPKNLLSPPPRAFFGSTSNLHSHSPWADDDGFGDWTGEEQADITTNAPDWGVWAEPSSHVPQPSPRPEEPAKRGSIAWPSSAATSPGLRPIPRSRASSVFRYHSPDPWATEISLDDQKNGASTTSLNATGSAAIGARRESVEKSELPAQDTVESPEVTVDDSQLKKEGEATGDNRSQGQEQPLSLPDLQESQESRNSAVDLAPKVEIHDTPSRPSSTFSLDSVNGTDRQDSPITSIDEDPKSRLQASSRKASSKVQELVGMFDDLAKAISEEPPLATRLEPPMKNGRGRSPSQTRSAEAGDDTDFGDFEDAKSDDNKSVSDLNPATSPVTSSTPKAQLQDAIVQDQTRGPTESPNAALETPPIPIEQLIEKFGPIQFDIDLQSIDKLFPDLTPDLDDSSEEASEVPDRIIGDSFTTISERKTWYRISRYGSMRKHDSGEDDNYHRVEWTTSHLHSDTIKIVRRWMEEDSISGRATLGAGNRTSVFNWDSSAAPVDLGKVFARKASVEHSRKGSVPPPNQSAVPPVEASGPDSRAKRAIQSPINAPDAMSASKATSVPSFSWNSDINSSPSTPHSALHNDKTKRIPIASRPTQATTKAKDRASPSIQLNQTDITVKDEEDDWGEMVSSPQVETQPNHTLTTPLPTDTNGTNPRPASLLRDTSNPNIKKLAVIESSNSVPKLSVSIPQSSKAPQPVPSQIESSSATASKADPWPLADFSVFESPTAGSVSNWVTSLKTKPKPNPKVPEDNNIRMSMDKMTEARTPLKAVLGPIQKSNHEQDQDQDGIVNSIVQNLPDLSYMLR